MASITSLPPDIVAQIAAGEVIERPAYAVKELVENALDAGATRISIEIEEGGLKKILIHDNGFGMSEEDISLCYLPHTTSKLKDMQDLAGIRSMGFRGEALYSIAAISSLTIQSKQKNALKGKRIIIREGDVVNCESVGMPVGTTIIVEHLFSNTPVRKKYLRSPLTEFRYIVEIITQLALAFPEVGFSLKHGGKSTLEVPPGQTFEERVEVLVGEHVLSRSLPVHHTNGQVTIKGIIMKPFADKPTHSDYVFINKRHVHAPLIASHVKKAYGTLLEPRISPFFLLFVTVPYHYVDVNIHPRKEQVHILHEDELLKEIVSSVGSILASYNLTYTMDQNNSSLLHDGGTKTYAAKLLKREVDPWGKDYSTSLKYASDVLQVHNVYLIVQTKKGILVVDQHAAHERILYEQFLAAFQEQKKKKSLYRLPKALIFSVSRSEAELVREHIESFQSIGFDIEEFGPAEFKITSVPELLQDRNIEFLVREVIQDLADGIGIKSLDVASHKMLAYLACRTAIKAGDKLSKEQAKDIILKLAETKTQYACPHGRPVKTEVSTYELDRLFRRK